MGLWGGGGGGEGTMTMGCGGRGAAKNWAGTAVTVDPRDQGTNQSAGPHSATKPPATADLPFLATAPPPHPPTRPPLATYQT